MQAPVGSDQQLLLIPEVAAYARVSIGTVRHWISIGKLASLRPGRRVMVRLAALQRLLTDAERGAGEAGAGGRP